MRKACWKRLGVASAVGVLALVVCPSASQAGDGVVALQTADPSCRDDSGNIYVDCGNGTVTDNRTGLVWLANADCLDGIAEWFTAMEFAAGLADLPIGAGNGLASDCGLSDGSSPGEWRLPSLAEWEMMVADAVDLGCVPAITSDSGLFFECWSPGCVTLGLCAFSDVRSEIYWTATTDITNTARAWRLDIGIADGIFRGHKGHSGVGDPSRVWPVRGGQ